MPHGTNWKDKGKLPAVERLDNWAERAEANARAGSRFAESADKLSGIYEKNADAAFNHGQPDLATRFLVIAGLYRTQAKVQRRLSREMEVTSEEIDKLSDSLVRRRKRKTA